MRVDLESLDMESLCLEPVDTSAARLRTGAEVIVETLERLGVGHIFGIPGGNVIPFYDALHAAATLRGVLVRHEEGAVHAAHGYAIARGEVGVCVATSGPGATNLITGMAEAFADSAPVLAITGAVFSGLQGTDAFQEADIFGMTEGITKHSFRVTSPDDIAATLIRAHHIATTGHPGPVLVDITKDAQQGIVSERDTNVADDFMSDPAPYDQAPPEAELAMNELMDNEGSPNPVTTAALRAISAMTPADTLFVSEYPLARWASDALPVSSGTSFFTSGGFVSHGFAVPAALGAKFARPDRAVWAVTDATGFQISARELATATVERMPIVVAVFSPDGTAVPDIAMLAEAMGAVGIVVEQASEIAGAVEFALRVDGRSVVLDLRLSATLVAGS